MYEPTSSPASPILCPTHPTSTTDTTATTATMITHRPVCDDYFDATDATVICQQFGLLGGTALTATSTPSANSIFGAATTSTPINMDDVRCVGTEASLSQCPYTAVSNCVHSEDAAVVCNPSTQGVAFQGPISCGSLVVGDTRTGVNTIGNTGREHYYAFNLTSLYTNVTFNTCDSQFDTWIRIVNASGAEVRKFLPALTSHHIVGLE